MIRIKSLLSSSLLLFVVGVTVVDQANAAPKPNILFLFADDQREDYCFGSSSGAVCVPSRAILPGTASSRFGMGSQTRFRIRSSCRSATSNAPFARQMEADPLSQYQPCPVVRSQSDPDETVNLATRKRLAKRVDEMTKLMVSWQKRVGDKLPLTVAKPATKEIDMTGRSRANGRRWQPDWILKKYFGD